MRAVVKSLLNLLAMAVVAPAAATCWLQEQVISGTSVFDIWTHVFAQLPGLPGQFLRRGFYRWLLPQCAANVIIGYGTLLGRDAELGPGAYIGTYALVGWVRIGGGALIGSRVSIPSGGDQHRFLPSGTWSPTEPSRLKCVTIGANTWIGEAAVIMADVGERCMVAAGAVVASPLPDEVMVAGNPARFVRRVTPHGEVTADAASVSPVH